MSQHDQHPNAEDSARCAALTEAAWNEENEETCEMCGGDGVIEYLDHPEVWGEDCPSYKNHFLPCPECRRREERQKANPPNDALPNGCPPVASASPKTPDGHPLGAATGYASEPPTI